MLLADKVKTQAQICRALGFCTKRTYPDLDIAEQFLVQKYSSTLQGSWMSVRCKAIELRGLFFSKINLLSSH